MKVAFFGPYPPPAGGISVHIKRLSSKLESYGMRCNIYDLHGGYEVKDNKRQKIESKIKWLIKYFFNIKEDVIHVHMHDWKYRAFLTFVSRIRRKKVILTFHSLRDELSEMSLIRRIMVLYVLKNANYLIATGDNEQKKLMSWYKCGDKILNLSAFIPPRLEDDSKIPEYIEEFTDKHKIIISANASNMNFYNNVDLYGLDMCIELCERLSRSYDVGFIYCLTRVTDKNYFEEMCKRIEVLNIKSKFLIVTDYIEFWTVLKRSNIFIRPTNTDSYGVSVAEAISIGVPSIASNVCKRADGTVIFQNRNSEELYYKTDEVLKNYEEHKNSLKNIKIDNCFEEILKIYQNILKTKK